jgi:hypothetical protein
MHSKAGDKMENMFGAPMLAVAALVTGAIAALLGGALSGYIIGGKDLGAEVATQIGGLFGALSGLPGIAAALIILMLIG